MFLDQLFRDILIKIWEIAKKAFTMSFPALRQPKFMKTAPQDSQDEAIYKKPYVSSFLYVIVTLRDERKLVISSDAYHGILMMEELYHCVFCGTSMETDVNFTQYHKNSPIHQRAMDKVPYAEEFADNLIKKLNKDQYYCQICNIIITTPFLARHTNSEVHANELEKAAMRVSAYTSDN